MRIVLEGVTGTGKSSVIAALKPLVAGLVVVPEELTVGELMAEIRDAGGEVLPSHLARLDRALEAVDALADDIPVVLERFHPTFVALGASVALVAAHDAALAARGFEVVLLDLPDAALRARSLHHATRPGAAAALAAFYGGEPAALAALRLSQARRRAYLAQSALASRILDTSSADFAHLALEILSPA
jgi:hypothetical protein